MPKLTAVKPEDMKTAVFDINRTVESVRFLMNQLTGMDAPMLPKVTFPQAGSRVFMIPNGADEPELTTSIEGLIVYHHAANAYWVRDYADAPHEPPQCQSTDGVNAVNEDGIETLCRLCPMNRLKSGRKGRGKACKNMARLLLLREGDALPLVIVLPPTSLGNFAAYIAQLTPRRLTPIDVITRITLANAANQDGVAYSRAQFTPIGVVNRDEVAQLRSSMSRVLLPAGVTESQEMLDTPATQLEQTA